MKIDVNYEKWIGETSQVSNSTLSSWAHYIKVTREKLIPQIKDFDERERMEIFLQLIEEEIKQHLTRPRPEPKIIEIGKGD